MRRRRENNNNKKNNSDNNSNPTSIRGTAGHMFPLFILTKGSRQIDVHIHKAVKESVKLIQLSGSYAVNG